MLATEKHFARRRLLQAPLCAVLGQGLSHVLLVQHRVQTSLNLAELLGTSQA